MEEGFHEAYWSGRINRVVCLIEITDSTVNTDNNSTNTNITMHTENLEKENRMLKQCYSINTLQITERKIVRSC